ncbi:MAG: glycosyltransferase [Elainella sp. C42_A2020_010]|nr:glycosyltransferase [Elainella sp. C42_A2020_010]RNJ67671.1 MAG: glycosyltransferase [Leptolyngbya sp. IPPAS B-1204]
MNTPLISVIIPAYNSATTIERTIRSVLDQTYTHFELLIINDGSTDRTLEVASSIQDERIKIFSYPNSGVHASRNRGIAQAAGDYITFIDADDLWTADKLAAQLNALQQNPQAAVAYSWTDYIDQQDQFLRKGTYIKANGNVYAKLLVTNFLENGSNPLICKWAFAEVGLFDCVLKNAGDWDMWLRLAARYPFVCVAAPQILYRVSPKSLSTHLWSMETCCIEILEKNFATAPAELQPLRGQCFSNFYLYLALKALEASQSRSSSLKAIHYLLQAVKYDPSLPRRRQFLTLLTLVKAFLGVLFSPQIARQQLSLIKKQRQVIAQ